MEDEDPQRWARAGIPYAPPEERIHARESAEGSVPDPQTWEYDYYGTVYAYQSGAKQERATWRLHRPYVLAKQSIPHDLIVVWEMDDPKADYDEGDGTAGGGGLLRKYIAEVDAQGIAQGYPKAYARWLAGVHTRVAPLRYTNWDPARIVPLVPCGWCPVLEAQDRSSQPRIRDLKPVSSTPSRRTLQPTVEDDFHTQHTMTRAEREEYTQLLRVAQGLE